ncbi:cysteine hydrolase [Candidatus Methylacidiphilum infernorum]|uniref:Cysteine hydrolase n=1 Tax=Candidatus Methylacidiphilum infernorum TaxID=511746 RepID=A0ABX7PWF4_9BACT|nr:isochorismatase family cysteine hydrolase [Candidatus Methylacidiphilum infernorum]QSR87058.1 cysteine hydrolase [Candidatus Methylacidiphilum infernorum]
MWDSPCVVVVDMLEDFVRGKLAAREALKIIDPIRDLISMARSMQKPVIYVGDAHFPHDPEIAIWGEHAMKGSEGAAVIKELAPLPGDIVLEKRTYSGFRETGLDLILRSLKIDCLVLVGLHTHLCIRHTAADAFFLNYPIVIPVDCVCAFSTQEHESALEYLHKFYGAELTTSQSLRERWKT